MQLIAMRNGESKKRNSPSKIKLGQFQVNLIRLQFATIILLAALVGCYRDYGRGTTTGEIFVDTPEVFTRERIISDRLSQHSWLQSQLDKSDDPLLFNFQGLKQQSTAQFLGILAEVSAEKTLIDPARGKAAFGGGTIPTPPEVGKPKPGDQSQSSAGTEGPNPPLNVPSPASIAPTQARVTPIDNFRDMLAYREEIRTEMIETQLDDRHDLQGNTLYRFKFDATIVPEHDTSAWAIIRVRFEDPTITEEDYKKLYRIWGIRIQKGIADRLSSLRATLLLKPDGLSMQQIENLAIFIAGGYAEFKHPDGCNKQNYGAIEFQAKQLSEEADTLAQSQAGRNALISGQAKYFLELAKARLNVPQRTDPDLNDDMKLLESILQRYIITFYGEDLELAKYLLFCEGPKNIEVILNDEKRDEFIKNLTDKAKNPTIYSYAVTPKESVQRISDIGSRKEVTDLLLTLSAISGTLQTSEALRYAEQTEGIYNAIQRQPLIVGFGDARGVSPEGVKGFSQLGWLIGPKFALSPDGTRAMFRQTPIQNALSATVSLPAWWPTVKVLIDTCWLGHGVSECTTKPFTGYRGYTVKLPQDPDALDQIFAKNPRRSPIFKQQIPSTATIRIGHRGSILIKGRDLWRSTVVTVGPWRATQIFTLPSGRESGIIAEFAKESTINWSPTVGEETVPVIVWTSEGSVHAGNARIVKDSSIGDGVVLGARRFVRSNPMRLTLSDPNLLGSSKIEVGIKVSGDTTAAWQFVTATLEGQVLSATFSSACQGCRNGVLIDIGLRVPSAPDQSLVILKERPVFYLSEDDALTRLIDQDGTVGKAIVSATGIVRQIRLKFPLNAPKAFIQFDPEQLTLTASQQDKNAPSVNLSPVNCDKSDPIICTYNVTVAQRNVPPKTEFKYSLKLGGPTDVPTIKDKDELTIKY